MKTRFLALLIAAFSCLGVQHSTAEEIKVGIMNDEQWLASIGEKADRKGISLEEMMDLDAMWILVQEIKNQTNN